MLPGLANTHSHAFHRALRGRTHSDGGTFWTWRERMYALAGTLSPEAYLDLARATYAEMALAGVTAVGSSTTCTTAPTGTRTPSRTSWRKPCGRPRATRACGSRCSTPATCRAVWTPPRAPIGR
ncbi:amidohydrolase family protein [Cellulomonas soli]